MLPTHRFRRVLAVLVVAAGVTACGAAPDQPGLVLSPAPVAGTPAPAATTTPSTATAPPSARATTGTAPAPGTRPRAPRTATAPAAALVAGNPTGRAAVPAAARAVDTSRPDRVVGTRSPSSCTSAAVVAAVAAGGVITFACGPAPTTITLAATAKVRNASPRVVIDGGGLITLSGGGARRILYMNTCDQAQGFTTSHCQDQPEPQLTVQNITFADGNSTGELTEGGGGGAIFVRGGRVKVVHARFVRNRCDSSGPDLGGGGLRALSQSAGAPVYVVDSTFDGGTCSNGGALSSIGVSWVVLNSVLSHNSAVGHGANPARSGTGGGGNGGAIATDGNGYTASIEGSVVEDNHANEGGGAVFFVSNDRTGTLTLRGSTLRRNPSAGFETAGYPGVFFLGAGKPVVTG